MKTRKGRILHDPTENLNTPKEINEKFNPDFSDNIISRTCQEAQTPYQCVHNTHNMDAEIGTLTDNPTISKRRPNPGSKSRSRSRFCWRNCRVPLSLSVPLIICM